MPVIKNPKGRLVGVSQERYDYLLDPQPVMKMANGQPKLNNNGQPIRLARARHEEGYTKPSKEEIAAYEKQYEEELESAEEVEESQRAAQNAVKAAAQLSAKAVAKDQKNATGKRGGRKSNAEKEAEAKAAEEEAEKARAEMEAKVRDAEGDKAKYDALSEEEKELYATLGLSDSEEA